MYGIFSIFHLTVYCVSLFLDLLTELAFEIQALLPTSSSTSEGDKTKARSCEHNVVFTLAGCLFTRGLR